MTQSSENETDQASLQRSLRVADFDFELPPELIAQQPPAQRGTSRMLVVDRAQDTLLQSFEDRTFADFPSLLNPGDLLILNNSRVIPARLIARRVTVRGQQDPSAPLEVLLTEPTAKAGEWRVLVRPGKKVRLGDILEFRVEEPERTGTNKGAEGAETNKGAERTEGARAFRPLTQPQAKRGLSPVPSPFLQAEVIEHGEFGARLLRFTPPVDATNDFFTAGFFEILDQIGHMPLPPYIKRPKTADEAPDRERYQTVFAADRGSVAAPTAGLHFTPEILAAIEARGVEIATITLHVGLGTFAPLRTDRLDEIKLHSERYTLPESTAAALNRARKEGRRIVAVGTTTVRTLEHIAYCALEAAQQGNELEPHSGQTSIFISPGFEFRLVNAMLTNFHLPKSSLLMLVSAFAGPESGPGSGREQILAAYAHAVRNRYRFFSYGDCMFIS